MFWSALGFRFVSFGLGFFCGLLLVFDGFCLEIFPFLDFCLDFCLVILAWNFCLTNGFWRWFFFLGFPLFSFGLGFFLRFFFMALDFFWPWTFAWTCFWHWSFCLDFLFAFNFSLDFLFAFWTFPWTFCLALDFSWIFRSWVGLLLGLFLGVDFLLDFLVNVSVDNYLISCYCKNFLSYQMVLDHKSWKYNLLSKGDASEVVDSLWLSCKAGDVQRWSRSDHACCLGRKASTGRNLTFFEGCRICCRM